MRWVIVTLFVLGSVSRAFAADLDILRGSEPVGPAFFTNWTGFYVGGDAGVSDANSDFSRATQPSIAYVLRNTALEKTSHPSELPTLGIADQTMPSYGGFVGYNSQWQDLLVGLEANFQHISGSLTAPSSPISRGGLTDGLGNSYAVTITGTGSMANLNYVALRGRAGLILGNFLPYGFIGAVVGITDINVKSTFQAVCQPGSTPTCSAIAFSATDGRNSALLYGATVGGGFDYAFTQHLFVRGEFEYTRFAQFDNLLLAVTGARLGAGFKF